MCESRGERVHVLHGEEDEGTKLSCRRRLNAFGDGRQHGSKDDWDRALLVRGIVCYAKYFRIGRGANGSTAQVAEKVLKAGNLQL